MIDMDILECLSRIEANISSDKYEQLGIWTVGGNNGSYVIKSPVNTEVEWTVYSITGSKAGAVLISQNGGGNALDTTGATSYGVSGGSENNVLEGLFLISVTDGNSAYTPPPFWQPLGKGGSLYIKISGLASGACFVCIAFRRLLNRYIPAPPRIPPVTHSLRLTNRPQRMLAGQSQMEANAMEGRMALPGGHPYEHAVSPGEQHDPAAESRGIAAPLTSAQIVLAKLRGKQGMY